MINLFAYVDPASTALVWQILAGVLITMGVVLGIWWTKITTFFRSVWVKIFGGKKNNEEIKAKDEASLEVEDELTSEKTEAERPVRKESVPKENA